RERDPERLEILSRQLAVDIRSRHPSDLFRREDGVASDTDLAHEYPFAGQRVEGAGERWRDDRRQDGRRRRSWLFAANGWPLAWKRKRRAGGRAGTRRQERAARQ